MNWLDIVLIILIAGVAVWESFRGFGRAIFDALCLYGALYGATALSVPLAASLHLTNGAGNNHAAVFSLLFVILGIVGLLLSRFIYGMTLIHLGMFEGLLGLAAGVAVGMIGTHGIVQALYIPDPNETGPALIVANGTVSQEMLTYHNYHAFINTLTGAASYRRELPNPH